MPCLREVGVVALEVPATAHDNGAATEAEQAAPGGNPTVRLGAQRSTRGAIGLGSFAAYV
jgi:hypothetical protein